jgi:hypothetical protein
VRYGSPWVYALIVWLGGIAATIAGSWIASKIRIYHDNKQSHYEDVKTQVLRPLCEALAKNSRLFRHVRSAPAKCESLGGSSVFKERAVDTSEDCPLDARYRVDSIAIYAMTGQRKTDPATIAA